MTDQGTEEPRTLWCRERGETLQEAAHPFQDLRPNANCLQSTAGRGLEFHFYFATVVDFALLISVQTPAPLLWSVSTRLSHTRLFKQVLDL